MTRKERVVKALRHEETDIVPYYCEFTHQMHESVTEFTGDKNFLDRFNIHLHFTQYCGYPTPIAENSEHFEDDFGVVWNRSGVDKDIGMIDRPLLAEGFKGFKTPVLDESKLRAELEKLIRTREDKFTIAGIGFSMFERSWSLCGMEDTLAGMLEYPDEYASLLDAICEYNCRVLDVILQYPVDAVYFGDDWGQQKGLIMGAKHWRNFIKPRMARMYAKAKKKGKFVAQHSCGDIEELFPDLIEIGLDCYQTFQPEIYDIEKVKREFGKDLAFWGGISTQKLLPCASPEKVAEETRRIMGVMKKGGGYIAAPTHAVPHDVPVENIIAMLEVFENQ